MIRTQPISTLTDTLCPCTTLFRAAGLLQATLVVPGVDLGDPQHAGAREARPADPSRLPAAAAILGAGPQHPHARAQLLGAVGRSEEHTSELQSLMRISYAVFCPQKKTHQRFI